MARTHKNFNDFENVNNRKQICDQLRQDSELFKVNQNHAGANDLGDENDNESDPLEQDFDFSEEDSQAGCETEDLNPVDKAFKKL